MSDSDLKRQTRPEADKFATLCMQQFILEWKATPEHLKGKLLTAITAIGIKMMHGTLGAKFTEGYLDEAKASLSDPKAMIFRTSKSQ